MKEGRKRHGKNRNIDIYVQLFVSFFYISTFTFGGGYVILPLIQKRFVEKLKWIDKDEMLDLISIAQTAPGAIAINTSVLVGYKIAKIRGGIIATLATVLPPFMIVSVIALFFQQFKYNHVVSIFMHCMKGGVAAVIISVVIKMTEEVIKEKNILLTLIMVVSFVLITYFKINVIYVILVCVAVGFAVTYVKIKTMDDIK